MKGRILFGFVTVGMLVAAAAVFATSSFGLTSTAVARGSADTFGIHDSSQKLQLESREPLDVDIRFVTMSGGEQTGWHGHAGPSLVIVTDGSLTVSQPAGGSCDVSEHLEGTTFVHPEDAHNFVAGSDGAKFYIVYLLPQGGSPAPIAVATTPSRCS